MVRLTAIARVALLAALTSLLPPAAHSRAAGMAISATGSSTGQGLRPASPPWEPAGVPIVDGLVITNSVTLEPGVYNVEDIAEDGLIFIDGDDITLDGAGVYINGVDYGGYGIVVNALGSGGDVVAAILVVAQVPPMACLCFQAGRAYWRPT